MNENLKQAIKNNDIPRIEKILKEGVSIHAYCTLTPEEMEDFQGVTRSKARTDKPLIEIKMAVGQVRPLHIACMYATDAVVERLLELGADVNMRSSDGLTPMGVVITRPEPASSTSVDEDKKTNEEKKSVALRILDLLMKKGADPLATIPMDASSMRSFTSSAFPSFSFGNNHQKSESSSSHVEHYNYSDVKDLVKAIQNNDDITQFIKCNTHRKDEKGTALYTALTNGNKKHSELLINAGNLIKPKHYFAAGCSLAHLSNKDAISLFNLLPKERAGSSDSKTETRSQAVDDLVDAIQKDHSGRFSVLIEAGAFADDTNGSALYAALTHGRLNMVKTLLEKNIEVRNKHLFAAGCAIKEVGSEQVTKFYEIIKTNLVHAPNFDSTNPRDILGVTTEATHAFVGRRYRFLARQHHPDRADGDAQFKKLQTAYTQLSNRK